MKRFLMCVIFFLLVMSAMAENKENIIPDRSIWGISRGELKELYDLDFIECKVGGKKCLMTSNTIIGSYSMNVYYVFGEIMINSKGLTYSGLTKIAYILDDGDKQTKEEIDQCYETLVSVVKKEVGEPDSIAKAVTTWNGKGYKLEVGKGKFNNYTGSKKINTAIIVTGIDIPKPTLEPTPTPVPTPSPQSVLKVFGLSNNKVEREFSLQNGKIKYGMSMSDVRKVEGKNNTEEISHSYNTKDYLDYSERLVFMTKEDVAITYYFKDDKLISIGYNYDDSSDCDELLEVLKKKYGDPVPTDNVNKQFKSLYKLEEEYTANIMEWGNDYFNTGDEYNYYNVAQWQLQFDDCYVVIDLFEIDQTIDIYGYEIPHVGYGLYSAEMLQAKYAELENEIANKIEEEEEDRKREQRKKKKMLDQL